MGLIARVLSFLGRVNVRVEGLLVSVRIHQRKDSRGDRDGGGVDRGGRDCSAGYYFGLWGGWNI